MLLHPRKGHADSEAIETTQLDKMSKYPLTPGRATLIQKRLRHQCGL